MSTRRLLLSLCLGSSLAFTACGGSQKTTDAQTEAILNENSPYSFHRALANTLIRTKQFRRAMPHVRKLMKLRPEQAEPLFLMGKVYEGLGLHQPAIKVVQSSLERSGPSTGSYAFLGVLHDRLGKHEEAESWHRKALELDESRVQLYNNLGFCLYLQERYEEAVATYMMALERESGSRRLLNNLAFAFARMGKYREAEQHFRAAGTEAAADNNMGLAYEMEGKLENAYTYYSKAAAKDAALKEAHQNLKRVCDELERPLPAFAKFRPSDQGDDQ